MHFFKLQKMFCMKYTKLYVLLFVALLFVQCQSERDAYYEAPEWMGKSIYETLKERGRFDLYLELADKTDYSISLKGNGFWTVFAPNDDAVRSWLAEKGYSSVNDVVAEEAAKIVAYSLLFNQYKTDQLSHVLNVTWDSLASVKKRTAYYETIRQEESLGEQIWVVNPIEGSGNYIIVPEAADNNYKYLPFYMERQFNRQGLTAADYEMFYPNAKYTGKNIQRATLLDDVNILASNGVIHEVDKVNEPLPNIEEILGDPKYSMFMGLIQMKEERTGEPLFYTYLHHQPITNYYQKMFPSQNIDRVYLKYFDGLSLFINAERYRNSRVATSNDHEKGGITLFAPNNAGVEKFFEEKLSRYFESIDDVPADVWSDFINAQFCDEMVYPAMFVRRENVFRDFLNGEGLYGPKFGEGRFFYDDIRPASNGFFYGGDSYISNRQFETVITEIKLNKAYDYMKKSFDLFFSVSLASELTNSRMNGFEEKDFAVFLIPDELFQSEAETPGVGYEWGWSGSGNDEREQFFHHWDRGAVRFANDRMQRLVRSHVFVRSQGSTLNGGLYQYFRYGDPDYDQYGYALNEFGDMVRFNNRRVQAIGNWEKGVLAGDRLGDWVTVTQKKDFLNGWVYEINKLLQYNVCRSEIDCRPQPMAWYLDEAVSRNGNISRSVAYLKCLMPMHVPIDANSTSQHTILLPNNNAIQEAIDAGLLPELNEDGSMMIEIKNDDGVVTDVVEDWERVQLAMKFFNYHVIQGVTFIDDGQRRLVFSNGDERTEYKAPTLHRLLMSGTYLRVRKLNNRLIFTDDARTNRKEARVVTGSARSNQFAPRAVIHEIDTYFVPPTEDQIQ